MAESLSWYLEDARSLLRDDLGIWTSTKQLTRWINFGRRQTARATGCCRFLVNGQSQYGASAQPGFFVPGAAIPGNLPGGTGGQPSINAFQTIENVESYPFSFGAEFMRKQYAGSDLITDIIDLGVQWGANSYRPVLNWAPWEEMQAYMRAWSVLNSAFPMWWATQGDNTNQVVYLWPPPVETLEFEWDVIAVPANIYSDDDVDILPSGFQSGVKFFASGMSLLNSRPAQAAVMFDRWMETNGIGRTSSDFGKSSTMYGDVV